MSSARHLGWLSLYASALILVCITVLGVLPQDGPGAEPPSYLYYAVIETDRDTISVGESFTATVYLCNPGDRDILLEPIRQFAFSGNSLYGPEPVNNAVFLSYPGGTKIKVGAGDRTVFLRRVFTPLYPGPFMVTCPGAEATVNVTGARRVPISSPEVGLKVEFSVTGRLVHALLILVNDNPYPVEVPVFMQLTRYKEFYGFSSNTTSYISWAIRFFEVEAHSTKVAWREEMGITGENYEYVCIFYVEGRVAGGSYPPP